MAVIPRYVILPPGPIPDSAEERGLWDQLALRLIDLGTPAADCYTLTKSAALDLIRARREALATLHTEATR